MFKALAVSVAIFAAPAMANATDPLAALSGIIQMEAAWQFCGLPVNEGAVVKLADVVLPHVNKSPQEFVDAVRRAAGEFGAQHVNSGTIGVFCGEMGRIYGGAGK